MVSRLVPLLIAAVAAAPGCGGSDANNSRGDARADPTGAHAPAADAAVAATRTNVTADDLGSSVEAVGKTHARIWATGDSAGGTHAAAVARLIRRGRPDKVLYLGDIYGGGAGFRAYRRLFRDLRVARTPGNHDWPRFWTGKREWYSFTAAGWRVIELNSETGRDSQQLAWLRSLIRAREGDCRIAFWHRPRFSAGPHGDNRDMDPYWRALQDHARIVVSGHDHDMQRFEPRGTLTQLISGAGGYSHYRVDERRPGLAFADAVHWGALRIELSRGNADVAFVSTAGRVLDRTRLACRA
jgi:hypothetical protein